MSEPREVEERIDWFLSHNPSGTGMCARHTWHSLGGDYDCPPAWGCEDANECVDKVKASGRYWTPQTWDGPPPRGAWVGWKYGNNGHAALSNGDGRITTTDPSSGKPTGTEPLDYPKRWGFNDSNGDYTVWTDQYNGVRFTVGTGEDMELKYDYLEKPGGTQTIGTSYTDLDMSKWDSPFKGWENTLVYLNITPTFKSGKVAGVVRVRLQRENGDAHAPDSILIHKEGLDEDGVHTAQYYTFEQSEKGQWTKIQLKCEGGISQVKLSTRYTTKALVG